MHRALGEKKAKTVCESARVDRSFVLLLGPHVRTQSLVKLVYLGCLAGMFVVFGAGLALYSAGACACVSLCVRVCLQCV